MAKKVKKKLNKKGLLVVLLTLYLFIMAFYYCFNLPVKLVEVKGNTLISDEKVINNLGEDNTSFYFKGAAETLRIAKLYNCKVAILKEKSPSCGTKRYDGTFSKRLIDKNGITAKLLADNDIRVISSDDHESIEKLINQIKNRNFNDMNPVSWTK